MASVGAEEVAAGRKAAPRSSRKSEATPARRQRLSSAPSPKSSRKRRSEAPAVVDEESDEYDDSSSKLPFRVPTLPSGGGGGGGAAPQDEELAYFVERWKLERKHRSVAPDGSVQYDADYDSALDALEKRFAKVAERIEQREGKRRRITHDENLSRHVDGFLRRQNHRREAMRRVDELARSGDTAGALAVLRALANGTLRIAAPSAKDEDEAAASTVLETDADDEAASRAPRASSTATTSSGRARARPRRR
jgi:hypothetical protein